MCKHQPELGQQPADAVHAGGALGLEAFTQAVDAQQALLLHRLDGHEVHRRAAGRLTYGGRVVGVVLAASALAAVRRHQMSGHDAGIQTQRHQTARPVVGAGAGLHRHHAARRQLGAPGHKLLARKRSGRNALTGCIHGVNLDHVLGQIDADSCNLVHGTSPLHIGLQIDFSTTSILALVAVADKSGKSLRIQSSGRLRRRLAISLVVLGDRRTNVREIEGNS